MSEEMSKNVLKSSSRAFELTAKEMETSWGAAPDVKKSLIILEREYTWENLLTS